MLRLPIYDYSTFLILEGRMRRSQSMLAFVTKEHNSRTVGEKAKPASCRFDLRIRLLIRRIQCVVFGEDDEESFQQPNLLRSSPPVPAKAKPASCRFDLRIRLLIRRIQCVVFGEDDEESFQQPNLLRSSPPVPAHLYTLSTLIG